MYNMEKIMKHEAIRYLLKREKSLGKPDTQLDLYISFMDKDEIDKIKKTIESSVNQKEVKYKVKAKAKSKIKIKKMVDITIEIRPELINIVRKLKIEDVIRKDDLSNLIFKTNQEALSYLKTLNLFKEIKDTECHFFKENIAWIGEDPKGGNIRYFSKNEEKNIYFCLDIMDLFQLFNFIGYYGTLDKMLDFYNVPKNNDRGFREMNKKKYIQNNSTIENWNVVQRQFTSLHHILTPTCLLILQKLNDIGLDKILTEEESLDGQSIFFASNRYVADFLEMGNGSVNKPINVLACLGLIKKINMENVPANLLERALEEMNKNKWNMVTFFILPVLNTEILLTANELAKTMHASGLKTKTITMDKVKIVLGNEVYNNIYANTAEKAELINKIKDSNQKKREVEAKAKAKAELKPE